MTRKEGKMKKDIWVKCSKCKGTGINPHSLMIEPIHKQICPKCKGTGRVKKEIKGANHV